MVEERPRYEKFASSEELLAFIKEKSDDIDRVVIPQMSELQISYRGMPVTKTDKVGMILHMIDHMSVLVPSDAEMVLNDGILNRMNIKIELWHPNKI